MNWLSRATNIAVYGRVSAMLESHSEGKEG